MRTRRRSEPGRAPTRMRVPLDAPARRPVIAARHRGCRRSDFCFRGAPRRKKLSACGVRGGARQSSRSRCHLRIGISLWCVNSWALGLFAFVMLCQVCFLNARGSQKADGQHQCVSHSAGW